MGLQGANPNFCGRVVEMLHATTDISLSNAVLPLLMLFSKSTPVAVEYTHSPYH